MESRLNQDVLLELPSIYAYYLREFFYSKSLQQHGLILDEFGHRVWDAGGL